MGCPCARIGFRTHKPAGQRRRAKRNRALGPDSRLFPSASRVSPGSGPVPVAGSWHLAPGTCEVGCLCRSRPPGGSRSQDGPGRPCGASVRAAGLLCPLTQLLPSPRGCHRPACPGSAAGKVPPLAPARPGATAAAGLLSGAQPLPAPLAVTTGGRASVPMGPLWPRSRTGLAGPHSAQDQAEALPWPPLASQVPRAPASCRPRRLTETRAVAHQEQDERAHDQDFASTWAERPGGVPGHGTAGTVRGTRSDGIQAALTDPLSAQAT